MGDIRKDTVWCSSNLSLTNYLPNLGIPTICTVCPHMRPPWPKGLIKSLDYRIHSREFTFLLYHQVSTQLGIVVTSKRLEMDKDVIRKSNED